MADVARPGFRANLDGYLDTELALHRLVERRTRELVRQWQDRRRLLTSPADLAQEQQRIRDAVLRGLGGAPDVDPTPPPVTVTATRHEDGLDVDLLHYAATPTTHVTATLYRPTAPASSRGAVFFACGHAETAKADPVYQHVARRLAAAGLVVLMADPLGQGERHSYVRDDGSLAVGWGTQEHTVAGIQHWWHGRSVARGFLRDAMAGISLLASLPDVDPARIGVTGNSGGGLLTTLLMAVDPRVAAAAPGTFVTARTAYQVTGGWQDAEQHLLSGTLDGVDHVDLLLAFAPRPTLVLAAEYDFFPIEGTRATVAEAHDLLARCGGSRSSLELASFPVPHRYDPAMADAAAAFFAHHLGGDAVADDRVSTAPLTADRLRVTRSGEVALDVPGETFLFDDQLAELPGPLPPGPDDDDAVAWLSGRVSVPRRRVDGAPRWFEADDAATPEGSRVRRGFWFTEDGVPVAGVVRTPLDGVRDDLPLTIELQDAGTPALAPDWAPDDDAVLALDVRGTGALVPHERDGRDPRTIGSSTFKLGCDLLWLGDSWQAGRAWDVVETVRLLREGLVPGLRPGPIRLRAWGLHTFTALLAGVLDAEIAEIELHGHVDPRTDLTTRAWDADSGRWQWVLPGYAGRFDEARVERLLGDRLRLLP
ncbi:hypothetical protein Bcav_0599 [Beutenbergia cavernae DSM 12333]|uniref:Acetyl xylan esterase domain-containing protein n=1 Tax=Beutenbergia cavernae (strain ATCC BAA-8 / DSM 12333 / CCUG 43141 / JCM 11478 / NBRC 16432 / NCIMB 13614 / HKI 0122) TaxID=471853 RepID=C5BXW8_BEUC1|nr:acetylxylan esterase [Beutenbergia cavernae]ACQ78862.1 hypothetical protein Bcav_0599 [Beutenbergia cavernae DSM 12333]